MNQWFQKIYTLSENQRILFAVATFVILIPILFSVWLSDFREGVIFPQTEPSSNETIQQETPANPSPARWVIETAGGNSFRNGFIRKQIVKIDYLLTTLSDTLGPFSDVIAEAENRLLPGFNKFMRDALGGAREFLR